MTEPVFSIRPAGPDDFDAIQPMMRDFYGDCPEEQVAQDTRRFLDPAGKFQTFVACRDGVPAAFAVATDDEGGAWINGLYVSEACRNAGIGRRLLLQCEEWAQANRYSFSGLTVLANNEPAKHLYNVLGYRTQFNMVSGRLGGEKSAPEDRQGFTMRRAKPEEWPVYDAFQYDPRCMALLPARELAGEDDFRACMSRPGYPTEHMLIERNGVPVGIAGLQYFTTQSKMYEGVDLSIGVNIDDPGVKKVLDEGQGKLFLALASDHYLETGRSLDFHGRIHKESETCFTKGQPETRVFLMRKSL
jgi:ribosomal protein S18 acetylase RimI-like enzyme